MIKIKNPISSTIKKSQGARLYKLVVDGKIIGVDRFTVDEVQLLESDKDIKLIPIKK